MKSLYYFLFRSIFVSCGETQWERTTFPSGFSLEKPDYMSISEAIKPDAEIQLENVNRELYYVMDVRPKSELEQAGVMFDLKAFSASLRSSMTEEMKSPWEEDLGALKCGDLQAQHFQVGGKSKFGPKVSYLVMVVDAGDDFLIQTAWTPSAQKTSWFNDDMKRIMTSLQRNH
ncbi:MAG TPA: hypothetical protein DEP18_01035 [Flavobacteriales bacterium]|nr:hypothetical protein [Flavobacteriales bacterium]